MCFILDFMTASKNDELLIKTYYLCATVSEVPVKAQPLMNFSLSFDSLKPGAFDEKEMQ